MCPTCLNRRTITDLSPHSYRFGAWITRPCDCVPRDADVRGPSSDELKQAALDRRNALEANT